ncbi:12247_t:CDS:1, partial [Funneliformis caledonium]
MSVKAKKYLKQISLKNKLIIVKDSPFEENLLSEEGSLFKKDSEISSNDEIM